MLKDAGIELEGKIAMANYGAIYRGTKVKNAQDNGMAGCIIFTDPLDDGEVTEENGYDAYPGLWLLLLLIPKHCSCMQTDPQGTHLPFNAAVSASRPSTPATQQP